MNNIMSLTCVARLVGSVDISDPEGAFEEMLRVSRMSPDLVAFGDSRNYIRKETSIMIKLEIWVSEVGFKHVGEKVYRGRIHSDHLQSVQQALTAMGLTCAHSKTNFEIWSSEDDKEVVLVNHSSGSTN